MKKTNLTFTILLLSYMNLYSQSANNIFLTRLLQDKIPDGFFLEGAKVNPFSPVYYTNFGISDTCFLEIIIKKDSSQNQMVNKIYNKFFPGYYRIEWNTRDTSGGEIETGSYVLKIIANCLGISSNLKSSFIATTRFFYIR